MVEQIRQGDIPGVQLRCRLDITAQQSDVWLWLTEPEKLGRWIADRAIPEPTRDDAITFETSDSSDSPVRERVVTLEARKPDRLVLNLQQLDAAWPVPTRVTFELTGHQGGTEVSVLQEGFAHLPLSDCLTIWETYRRRWRAALQRLAEALQH